MRKLLTFLSSTLLLVFCLSLAGFAQETTGGLQGTVKDPSGAVIPGASVTLKGVTAGFNRTVTTDETGFF